MAAQIEMKAWTTADFVDHYFRGNGRTVNLASVGLLSHFRRHPSVMEKTQEFKLILARQTEGPLSRQCIRDGGMQQVVVRDNDRTVTDVTGDILRLFSLGRSTFFRSGWAKAQAHCGTAKLLGQGRAKFSIQDKFEDVRDLRSNRSGNQEIILGKPYRIVTQWSEPFSFSSTL